MIGRSVAGCASRGAITIPRGDRRGLQARRQHRQRLLEDAVDLLTGVTAEVHDRGRFGDGGQHQQEGREHSQTIARRSENGPEPIAVSSRGIGLPCGSTRMKLRLVLFSLLLATGCPSALEGEPPPSRAASGIVTSADGTISAQAFVRYSKGGVSVTSGRPDELVHVLMVGSQRVELARFTAGYLGETPPAEWKAAVHAELTVNFAPDGHAVSVSADLGKNWRHVVLDTGAPYHAAWVRR